MIHLDSMKTKCHNGHEFQVIEGVIDFMGDTSDEGLLEEQSHWDSVADKRGNTIIPDSYMTDKAIKYLRTLYKEFITQFWPDYKKRAVAIGEIGCGSGSAMSYLDNLEFAEIKYFGADVSIKRLLIGTGRKPPNGWSTQFLRTSANKPIFNDNSIDIVFSAAALHHLDAEVAIELISRSIKPGGLFILNEPSLNNPFARVGRKMIKGFHTKGEKPLLPRETRQAAVRNKLNLVYEKGFQFFTGPLEYLVGMAKPPKPIVIFSYYFGRMVDSLVSSVSLNYSFIQIFQKIG